MDIMTINGEFYRIQKKYKKIEKHDPKHQIEAKDRRLEEFCDLSWRLGIDDLILMTTLFRIFLRDKGLTPENIKDYGFISSITFLSKNSAN